MNNSTSVIAILDDEPAFSRALGRLLSEHGFGVDLFANGEALLAAHSNRPSDCILLDLQMPEMDGFEVLKRLGAKALLGTPVVIISGQDMLCFRERANRLGASAYLTKPVDEATLLDAIGTCLDKRATSE